MSGYPWTVEQLATLKRLYADTPSRDVAKACRHSISSVYRQAAKLGVKKSAAFRASPASGIMIKGTQRGAAYRFPKGHVPANKGLRRPGWAPGRMRETQFKKGQWPPNKDPDFYVLGALRVNADGYIDMRIGFGPGALGWRPLHRVLWEDRHGPVPKSHVVTFKDRDPLNCWYDNFELISRAELCRRNSIHHMPPPLKSAILLLGSLKRRIHEKHRRSAHSPVCDTRGSARQENPDGSRSGGSGCQGRPGHCQFGEGRK